MGEKIQRIEIQPITGNQKSKASKFATAQVQNAQRQN